MGRVHGFKAVTDHMRNDMDARFGYMMDETDENFDCLHLIATYFDPNLRILITAEQVALIRSHLKQVMINIVSNQLVKFNQKLS